MYEIRLFDLERHQMIDFKWKFGELNLRSWQTSKGFKRAPSVQPTIKHLK